MTRRIQLAILALGALAVLPVGRGAIAGDAAQSGEIRVHFVGCPNGKGKVKCALYNNPDGFPMDRKSIVQSAAAPIDGNGAVCKFKRLPPGKYAVAAFQDEDGTDHMRKNVIGIPTEVYGFSNDARNMLSAPSFDQAAFTYPGGTMDITIHAK